jgi:hypothetical protein
LIGPFAWALVPVKSMISRGPAGRPFSGSAGASLTLVRVIRWVCSCGSSTPSCSA